MSSDGMISGVCRTEKKYLLSVPMAERLASHLADVMTRDPHDPGGGYTIRSLYFDTLFDRDYRDKFDGLENRRKIRMRIYNGSADVIRLEIKEKNGDRQRKRSLGITREEADRLAAGDYAPLTERQEPFAVELYGRMTRDVYRPKCIVEYDRRAFVGECNNIRVTFDRDLRASEARLSLFDDRLPLSPAGNGLVTMEVKYDGFLLSYISDLISACEESPVSQSKYCFSRRLA